MEERGLKHEKYSLLRGNFLDPEFRGIILGENRINLRHRRIILCNNLKFRESDNSLLKNLLTSAPDGTIVLTSLELLVSRQEVTKSNYTSFEAMVKLKEKLDPVELMGKSVASNSWTPSPLVYFMHEIDRKIRNIFMKEEISLSGTSHYPGITGILLLD